MVGPREEGVATVTLREEGTWPEESRIVKVVAVGDREIRISNLSSLSTSSR